MSEETKLIVSRLRLEHTLGPEGWTIFGEAADLIERLESEIDLLDAEIVHLHNILTPEQSEAEFRRPVDIQAVARRVQRGLDRHKAKVDKEAK